jgi:hypothetical protein
MERDLAGAAISTQEFERLKQACRRDRKFPQTYADWQALVSMGTSQVLAQGQQVEVIAVAVDDFVAWCRKVGVVPGLDALRAYMILRRGHDHGQAAKASGVGSKPGGTTPDEGNQALPHGTLGRAGACIDARLDMPTRHSRAARRLC